MAKPGGQPPTTTSTERQDEPLTGDEFGALLEPFGPLRRVAVAVSGGADSLALLRLSNAWAEGEPYRQVTALTVDHGLRSESATEAKQVAAWAQALGIPHQTLTWRGSKPDSNIQSTARHARYNLLTGWCNTHKADALLVAHHQDDQAETVLMRLTRGSGVDGLAAMTPETEISETRVLRPLLAVPKTRLVQTLKALGQPWIEDPSNSDTRYDRARLRNVLTAAAPAAPLVPRLAATAARMGRARAALDHYTKQTLERAAHFDTAGYGAIDVNEILAAPEEVGLRALAKALMTVSGSPYPPRLAALERLYAAVGSMGQAEPADALGRGRTLLGCRVVPAPPPHPQGRRLIIVREFKAIRDNSLELAPGEEAVWDNRFYVRLTGGPKTSPATSENAVPLHVRPLGPAGLKQIKEKATGHLTEIHPMAVKIREIHRAAVPTLPALWRESEVQAVPHLGFISPWLTTTAGPQGFEASFLPQYLAESSA